jgi:hypothetical protein
MVFGDAGADLGATVGSDTNAGVGPGPIWAKPLPAIIIARDSIKVRQKDILLISASVMICHRSSVLVLCFPASARYSDPPVVATGLSMTSMAL